MLAGLAGLALLALASAPRSRRARGLGEGEIVPREPDLPSGVDEVYLVERAMYVHPAERTEVAAKATADGSRWLVVPSTGWTNSKPFATAKQARTVLKAAGFKGPYGHGQATRWTR